MDCNCSFRILAFINLFLRVQIDKYYIYFSSIHTVTKIRLVGELIVTSR